MCLYLAGCLLTGLLVLVSFSINPLFGIVMLIVAVAWCWEMAKYL